MHYKNGREAKSGDKVVSLANGNLVSGILHSVNAESTTCNGRVAVTTQNDPYVNIKDCLHVDDVVAADVPDSSKV
jgi:argonaute-like protein implicated in RNA metabolism and viral defense